MWTLDSLLFTRSIIALFIASSVLAICVVKAKLRSNSAKFCPTRVPPGPWAWPIVGNLPSILAGGQPHQALARFAQRFGPVMGISLGPGPKIVVLTSLVVVKEFLTKNADSTSDRRIPPLLGLAFSTKGSVMWENGEKWKVSRRISLAAIRKSLGSSTFGATVRSSLTHLRVSLERLKGQHCNPRSDITSAIAEIICSLCFGHCVEVRSNPKIAGIMRAQHNLSRGLSGISLGHIFPRLYHTPLYRKLRGDIEEYIAFLKEVVEEHKSTHKENGDDKDNDGNFKESFTDVADCYLQQARSGENVVVEEEDIWRVMFDLAGAGTETTAETLLWGILYMCLFPEVQRQIHSEIDENFNNYQRDDVITYDERTCLPYTQATILEVLRCACVAPLSLPRVTSRDVTVLGYSIPRGTEIWVNEWAINRDRTLWSDPENFNPARFLDDSGRVDPELKESFMSFGEGRRMCLGRYLAEHMLFMFFTNILRWFTFRLPEDRRNLPDVNEGNFGLTYSPPHFDVIIAPSDRRN